jgi:hypothetical protein
LAFSSSAGNWRISAPFRVASPRLMLPSLFRSSALSVAGESPGAGLKVCANAAPLQPRAAAAVAAINCKNFMGCGSLLPLGGRTHAPGSGPRCMLHRLARLLSEPVMGFLALAALVFGMAPALFDLASPLRMALEAGEWLVIALFALEYAVHLALARDRRAFVLDPWRILDLVIIVAPLVSLIPGTPEFMRSSPFLRVLRLVRAILAGTRASARLRHLAPAAATREPVGPPRVTALRADEPRASAMDWPELLRWLEGPPQGWLHAANLGAASLDELARATGVSRTLLDAALGEASYPRLETGARWTTLVVPLPHERAGRESVLLLIGEDAVLSLTRFESELQEPATPLPATRRAWPLRVWLGIVRLALARHEALTGRIERELRALEELPADESPGSFFERTFVLRKRITAAKGDLWRLRGILRLLADGRRELPGLQPADRDEIGDVADEAEFLHETADTVRESLLSLLDLHLNVSGYGMNRFMRLLAIVSALALVPAVVGGLLGMNLVTNPWPATLAQVAFGVFVIMLCMLYTFLAKGWLK